MSTKYFDEKVEDEKAEETHSKSPHGKFRTTEWERYSRYKRLSSKLIRRS